jgi:ElaB/YqjD/DUF883 family membrane-anchored ribosome-binding protein
VPTTTTAKTAPDLETPDLDTIARDLAVLKQDVAALIAELRSGTAERARTMVQGAAEQVSNAASQLYGQATAGAERTVKTISKEVDEHPLSALMVAFAIGFVANRVLSR